MKRMARAVIRYSISGESTNVTGNAVRKALTDRGFVRVGRRVLAPMMTISRTCLQESVKRWPFLRIRREGAALGRLDSLWVNLYNPEDNDVLDFAEMSTS
jgi:hypothetical protein